MRFTVYRRALLLTAATMALLSGPALAADNDSDITTKVTTNLKTSTANAGAASNILIEANGSVVVSSTTPAITIDSSNFVTNKGLISNKDLTGAIGIQMNATGLTGGFDNIGTIDLTGSGQNKVGIEITDPNATSGTFTGSTAFPSPTTALTRPAAIYLESGSAMNITGDGSTGILVNATGVVNGDIVINGGMTLNPTSTTSTSGGNLVGINMLGSMTGDLNVGAGGTISVFGSSAHDVILIGELDGHFINQGTIQALGTLTPSTTATNSEAGSAIIIENNLTGGFYNAGPTSSSPNIASASIAESGTAPAVNFLTGTSSPANMVIGVTGSTTDTTVANYSFVNRGLIGGTALNANLNVSGVQFDGSSSNTITLAGDGIFNSGGITATSTTDISETGATTVEGIIIGGYSTVSKINNSNEASNGTISATVSGAGSAVAIGVDIQPNGSLTEIDNSGTISASASTTDTTVASLISIAINDHTANGTLTTINNSGQINALGSTLDNGLQVHDAIDLAGSTLPITLTDSGSISGSVILGGNADTVSVIGSNTVPATIAGNMDLGGGADVMTIAGTDGLHRGLVTGSIQEENGGSVDLTINANGTLLLKNDGTGQSSSDPTVTNFTTNMGSTAPLSTNLPVANLHLNSGGTLGLTLSQAFNVNGSDFAGAIIQTTTNTGVINVATGAKMSVSFGSFVSSTNIGNADSQFILLDAKAGNLTIGDEASINTEIAGSNVPFLFTGDVCTFNVAASADVCTGTEVYHPGDSELVFNLHPKTAAQLGLTGFALKMFPIANVALASDAPLGAALISGVTSASDAQAAYSAFAPDVTGSQRALAVALTDQATGAVGARQRALRMYAGQDGDATMWGQEFTERLNVGNQTAAAGFNDSGFGFVLGMDGGAPSSGRYGGAFTFYSGDTSEKEPRLSKTTSEWYMLTGYTDWRGKGFFFDSNLSIGYGSIDGKRQFDFGGVDRTADGKRGAALASGGVTAGVAMTAGGTVIMPQLSVDGLVMRQEKYTETNNGQTTSQAVDGFDLAVRQEYDQSLRSFAGLDIRQDMNFGEFFFQPEARLGYRYDFLNAAQKLKAEFVCSTAADGCGATAFDITGPDPAKGNLVAGGSIATTTGAWSIGLNYDYVRGVGNGGGKDSVTQSGTITLVGRI
jgi:autotransporter-like protein